MKDFTASNDNDSSPIVMQDDYQTCKTCAKDGKTIRGRFPRPDYLSGDFARASGALLNQFGLPHPKKKLLFHCTGIFRGTQHDMLFQRQGLISRIGPMNHTSILHPAILQPLIYTNDNDIGDQLTISISAGIRSQALLGRFSEFPSKKRLLKFFNATDQNKDDVCSRNCGKTDNGVHVLLDLDDQHGGTLSRKIMKQKKNALDHHMRGGTPWYLAARKTMEDVYGDHEDFDHYIQAYDYHQPLRAEIHDAVTASHRDDKRQKLSDFYNRCAQLVKAKDDKGLALYRPWTGKAVDNRLKEQKRKISLA